MFVDIRNVVLHSRAVQGLAVDDLSVDRAELVAIFIEALFYGVEALTFVATVYLLHGAKRTPSFFVKFFAVIIMFMLNTIHIGSSLRRILNAFVGTPNDPVPDAVGYLSDLAGFLYRFRNIIVLIQTVALDILVTYRCFMIWDKKFWIPILPATGVVGFIVTGTAAIHAFAIYTNDTLFTGTIHTWVAASLCITLLTKLACLAIVLLGTLIPRPESAWHASYLKANRHARLFKAMLVGIESGGLAILGAFILVPVYLAGRNAQGILWAALSPLTGQAFLLIVAASLLGLTPSASGASRRRKGGPFPTSRVTIPISSPNSSPISRFSSGSVFASPSTPSDKYALPFSYSSKHTTMEPAVAHVNPVAPFSTRVASRSISSIETHIRDALAYGGGDADREWRGGVDRGSMAAGDRRVEVSARRQSAEAIHLGRSADGAVEVLQKVHAAS